MHEHDHVELTRDIDGHRAGDRATVVGLHGTCVLLEFADQDGRTLDLPSVPTDAVRVVEQAAHSSAP